jgi:hypothetical protein
MCHEERADRRARRVTSAHEAWPDTGLLFPDLQCSQVLSLHVLSAAAVVRTPCASSSVIALLCLSGHKQPHSQTGRLQVQLNRPAVRLATLQSPNGFRIDGSSTKRTMSDPVSIISKNRPLQRPVVPRTYEAMASINLISVPMIGCCPSHSA